MNVFYKDFNGIAMTDGTDVYINSKYEDTPESELFLFHEEGHILLDHFARRKGRDLQLWNIAADLEIAIYLYPLKGFSTYTDMNEAIINSSLSDKILVYWEHKKFKKMGIRDYHLAEEMYDILAAKDSSLEENKDRDSNLTEDADEDADEDDSFQSFLNEYKKASTDFHSTEEVMIESPDENDVDDDDELDTKEKAEALIHQAQGQFFGKTKVKKLVINQSIRQNVDKLGKGALTFRSTYSRPNRSKVGIKTDKIYRGSRITETPAELFLFIDRSSSFNTEKSKEQEEIISVLEKKYRNKVKVKKLYFASVVSEKDDNDILFFGTNVNACFEYIEEYQPDMSIIITDSDYCLYTPYIDLKKSKVGFIFIECEKNYYVTSLVPRYNGILLNKTN